MKKFLGLASGVTTAMFVGVAFAAGSIQVKVTTSGKAPEARAIKMNADPKCLAMHAKPVSTDYVIVNGNGTLKNAFAYLKEGVTGKFTPPPAAVEFDQKGCQYSPHVFGLMAGQTLTIVNSDSTLHNVHAMPKGNPQFNVGMPVPNMKMNKKFDKAEMGVKIKCDVHPWMGAWANVMDHPFFSVTGDQGNADIKDVPAGNYTLALWHEKYGTMEQKITVAEGKPTEVEFKVDLSKAAN